MFTKFLLPCNKLIHKFPCQEFFALKLKDKSTIISLIKALPSRKIFERKEVPKLESQKIESALN